MSGIAQFMKWGPFYHSGELQTAPRLYHYAAGTTDQKDVWVDRGKSQTAAQPIQGNSDGTIAGFFSGLYKIVIKSSDDAIILEQWDSIQIVDPLHLDLEGEVLRIGPEGDGQEAEDVTPRKIRICGYWADPATPGTESGGDRIVIYDTGRDKTAIGMHRENGLWVQSSGADGQPAFAVWSAASFLPPVKRFEVTFDGRVKVASGGKLHLPVVLTANLPAAGAVEDGSLLIEDGGAGNRNLILYSNGERYRIDGGTPF